MNLGIKNLIKNTNLYLSHWQLDIHNKAKGYKCEIKREESKKRMKIRNDNKRSGQSRKR